MKKLLFSLVVIAGASSLVGCKKYKNKEVYANVPVYMANDEFRNSFEFTTNVPQMTSGNIYVYNQYIFISDEDKGIHIVDNSDAHNPYSVGFMNIVGNTQLSIKNNYLYANSVMDLLVIDISNIQEPTLVERQQNIFDYTTPVLLDDSYPVANVYPDSGIVVGWKIEKTKDVSGLMAKYFVKDCPECEEEIQEAKVASRTSISGSMSKFTISQDHLYVIDNGELMSFDISNAKQPFLVSQQNTWREAETIFAKDDYLFVGTTTGMIIYDNKSPQKPNEISEIDHTESCDPVVVEGDYAYVTLRSGNDCGQTNDELQVIDISNIRFPYVRKRYDMTNPHGLAVDGNRLFICDGTAGLKVYDNSEPKNVGKNLLQHFSEIHATDVILNNGILVLIGDTGLYQYEYTSSGELNFISLLVL